MKKILILTYRYPSKDGPHCSFGQYLFYEELKRHFEIKGICFGPKDKNDKNFVTVDLEPSYIKKLTGFITGKNSIRESHYSSKIFKEKFERILDSFKPNIIYVEHVVMMQYINQLNINSKIIFFDDESLLYIKANKLLKTFRERLKNRIVEKAEKKAIYKANVVLTITKEEKEFLLKENINPNIKTTSYGIDIDYFYYNWKPPEDKVKILYLGNFNHYPNREAVKFISKKILNEINENKKLEFNIVGRNTFRINKYKNSNMKIYENVPDVRPFYWNSTIFIAPIFYGGGFRTKLLEAASCGVPIIMSSLSNNGFSFRNGEEVFIANTPDEFIENIESLLADSNVKKLHDMSVKANQKIRNDFSKKTAQQKFIQHFI